MLSHLIAIFSGAIFVIGIIAGIGPQNLNTISHAIQKNYAWEVALTCFLADTVLILAGGIGLSLSGSSYIIIFINLIGLIFITIYLFQKVRGLFHKRSKVIIPNNLLSKPQAIFRALALTWLNPLVFIDTIVVIGGTATQYVGIHRIDFIIGAVVGDFIWLFGIVIIATLFAHKLNRSIVWLSFDIMTISIMALILYKTALFLLHTKIFWS